MEDQEPLANRNNEQKKKTGIAGGGGGGETSGTGSNLPPASLDKGFKEAVVPSGRDSMATGGWDFVFLRSEDNTVKLVELQDSQDRCSTVSTVLGCVGFSAPVTLAVPTCLFPAHGAVPVICGNVLELGDWDVSCADVMAQAPEFAAEGFNFFAATICSNYSDEEELIFRFALVSVPRSLEETTYREVICWEGAFARRMVDYSAGLSASGLGCLVFGAQEAQLLKNVSTASVQRSRRQLCPGWLSDKGLAAFVLRMEAPIFTKSAEPAILQCPVDVHLILNSEELTKFHRAPLASSSGPPAVRVDEADPSAVRFTAGSGSIRYVEFVQITHLGVAASLSICLRFYKNKSDIFSARARLPLLAVTDASPELEKVQCDLALDNKQPDTIIAELPVKIRRIRYCSQCPDPAVLRSVDRFGPLMSPPPGKRPIRIAVLPTMADASPPSFAEVAEKKLRFFELPVGLFQDGSLRCRLLSAPSSLPADAGLVARLVQGKKPAATDVQPPYSPEIAADAMLSALLCAEIAWTMIASSDMDVCAALCLKQVRLPVAFVASAADPTTVDTLEACQFYGIRAVAVRAPEATPTLAAELASRGLALYTYGGAPQSAEVLARLEGLFEEGTAVDLVTPAADTFLTKK